jgi:hypothetical protein
VLVVELQVQAQLPVRVEQAQLPVRVEQVQLPVRVEQELWVLARVLVIQLLVRVQEL